MQISAATLLASQSQAPSRASSAAAAFEPIAFKQTPPAASSQDSVKPTAPAAVPTATRAAISASPASGYVRPGTTIDIKI